jgi:hypothetical protein
MKNEMKHIPQHIPPTTVKRISVIFVEALRGTEGSKENPLRSIHLYYDDNGQVLACYDPINGEPDSFEGNIIVKGTAVGPTEARPGSISFCVVYNPKKNTEVEIYGPSRADAGIKIQRKYIPALISTLKSITKEPNP